MMATVALLRSLRAAPRRLGTEALLVALGMVVSVAGNAALLKIVTTYLSRTSYGLYALGTSALALAQSVAFGSLFVAMGRVAPDFARHGTVPDLLRHVGELGRRPTTIVVACAMVTTTGLLLAGKAFLVPLAWALVVLFLATNVSVRTTTLEQATRLRGTLVLHQSVELIGRVGLSLAFLAVVRRPEAAILALAVACFSANAMFERRVVRRLSMQGEPGTTPARSPEEERARLVQYWYPVAGATALSWIYSNADRWTIEHFQSVDATALYAGAAQLGALPFNILSSLMMNLASPILYARSDRDRDGTRRGVYLVMAVYVALAAIGWLLILLLRNVLVHLFLGPNLWDCAPLVPLIAAGWGFIQLSAMLHIGILAMGNARSLIVPNVATAAAAVAGTIALVPSYGSRGAAMALIATGAVRLVAMGWTFLRSRPPNTVEPAFGARPALKEGTRDS